MSTAGKRAEANTPLMSCKLICLDAPLLLAITSRLMALSSSARRDSERI
jgi:hypothetical protein